MHPSTIFTSILLTLTHTTLALPTSTSTSESTLDISSRAGGYGFIDPDTYFCNQSWITPSGISSVGTTGFRLKQGLVEKYNIGGFSMDTEYANITSIRNECTQQCTYAQYPGSPKLDTTAKCQTAYVAAYAPSTYTAYANNSSPSVQANTHTTCYFLKYKVTQADLVPMDKAYLNATAETISCPGVVFNNQPNTA